ncbi:response regulator [Roseiterribacter gracilis]|uniref:Two-component response regulator n=1 Tax=Roseiterribacter gracilis TaxID=2812848 RepID=A0A8S8XEP4_9PROT|nr:two-component response regulator [Rhodospirillales bacterium TMPK1]
MDRLYDAVATIVPSIRRYARLLVGSAATADAYAQTCLERLALTRPLSLVDLRRHVFHTLHCSVCDDEIALDTVGTDASKPLERSFLALPVPQRAAVLLHDVERFTLAETALILRRSVESVRQDLETGRAVMRTDLRAVFIIEDDWMIAEQISLIAAEIGLRVCGTASDRNEALAGVALYRPSLVLSDVDLGGGRVGGLALSDEIQQRFDVPVIFVTGYPERVQVHAKGAVVVTKPIDAQEFSRAVELVLPF